MQKVSIAEIQNIFGWSYPTALKYAQRNGHQIDGKWFVDNAVIQAEIDKMFGAANMASQKLAIINTQ